MLHLSEHKPFATGNHRAVYVHPHSKGRCVKVHHAHTPSALKRNLLPWYRRFRRSYHFDENLAELRQINKIQDRAGVTCLCLPSVEGIVETDLGPGLIVELITDANGRISRTAGEHVKLFGYTTEVESTLHNLRNSMIQHNIQIKDPGTRNIVFQKREDQTLRAVIIDGLGTPTILPIDRLSPKLSIMRIDAKISKIVRRLRKAGSQSPSSQIKRSNLPKTGSS
ncbi:YrbL family protein [Coraliomargarita sp. SDUM461003]|uniref:YrbL family protein n=1 Tax=Thalassobacterium maritimum TaxID=3041265 RepID=A0ABU1AYD4_9BACT|nr:YrbL family protein [Coraliomargarita sp. SDUM461003]MDQ8209173.1 YrbL family protein [Coraliomargarita sp. SDUM461003]